MNTFLGSELCNKKQKKKEGFTFGLLRKCEFLDLNKLNE